MVKVRMNTADVAAEVKCLRRLIGMRCSNVYDLSSKTYVFKLVNSSGVTESGESEKVLLLMESGIRLHTTAYIRDKSNTPSGFTLKLRKHIRTRRLEDVRQLGYDRIVLFQFGLGANAHYVILELYAQGNLILTDSEFMVLTLLRSHRDDDKGLAIMSRHRYPVEICRVFQRTSNEKIEAALTLQVEPDGNGQGNTAPDTSLGKEGGGKSIKSKDSKGVVNDGARAKQPTLKMIFGEALGYGPALAEHIILDADLIPNTKVQKNFKLEDDVIRRLVEAVAKFEDWLEDIISGGKIPEGFIIMQQRNLGKQDGVVPTAGSLGQIYDEFCPLLLNQFKSRDQTTFDTFDAALDEFYSKIESQRLDQQQKTKESAAMQKLDKIRNDQENRVLSLKKEVEHCIKMAELIEYNLEEVDSAILAVRVALANGMSWEDLARMVKEEKKSGNPVAGLIDKLHLDRNCMTLLLSNNLDEMDDDEKTQPADRVEVDLALSAHANARRWYEMKKKQESKQEKTITSHEQAFKAAERKTRLQLSQEKTVAAITHMRKVHWFEKFNWFISSENYLVISGRDAQQNELIVKRYMSKGDLYVHAELHGASSTVIKNHKPESPVPPLTLNQAGCFTVCHSQAWNSKMVTSAWWVYPHQVSKTAPTGEYLTVGSFMIRGKKNFLPPHPLVMGFGILFRLDESSLGSHLNERRVRGEEEEMNDAEESEAFKEVSDAESEKLVEEASELQSVPQQSEANSNDGSPALGDNTTGSLGDDPREASKALENNEESVSTSPQLEDLLDRALELGSATGSTKNYGAKVSVARSDNHHDDEASALAAARDKPYISKAQRKMQKKGQKDRDISRAFKNGEEDDKKSDTVKLQEKHVDSSKPCVGKISRGQRSKLKKIKEKYADQDDEERSIRMALLAAAGKVQRKDKIVEDEKVANAESKPADGHDDTPKVCYKCKKPGHLARDCEEQSDDVVHSNDALEDRNVASDMDKIAMEEDDIHEIGEEEKEKLNDVDYLTGIPAPNDVLLYAVPVCGPYSALQSYKYRVKLVPGTVKKGKAAKTAISLFGHAPEATVREKELMKACTDAELVAAILGNVKVTAAEFNLKSISSTMGAPCKMFATDMEKQ
ncbi:OLC1v1020534C1 [Oldenlandia corymbosa var. corymbosa]|uniref:OLC1v1020534C1 n=1 Tax=Oldenlandia corymbosa var. corymbosa TaxID=529605 RepID=A0AAV1EH58_OLDCO|nr:OLC1v1020534C1 [Oldenlandia corymbosa var. corymbosa]